MSYIGNARSLLIVGANARDDLATKAPGSQTSFELSKEVPGGYESNVTVLRQKYITEELVSNTTSITVDEVEVSRPRNNPSTERLLTCSNVSICAALAAVKVGDRLIFSIPSDTNNSLHDQQGFDVSGVYYTGTSIKIYLSTSVTGTVNVGSNSTEVSITVGYADSWNILEPERDYIIGGELNRTITLSEAPKLNDKVYVLHKGESTYNFVPTQKSVGPEQLTENLRNFRCDRYDGDGTNKTFVITATEDPGYNVVNGKTLLVTVDGEIVDCDDVGFLGDWKLDDARDSNGRQTITFHTAPTQDAKIRILNLGFSTVSRRALFATGQASTPGAGSVGENELKNDSVTEPKIRNGAVSGPKIRVNAVNGTKILLENNETLRSKTNTSVRATPDVFGLLKLNAENITELLADPELAITIAGTKKVSINSTEIYPETTDDVSLGTSTKKFKNLNLAGNISVDGDVNVGGKVDNVDISQLNNTVTQIKNLVNSGAFSPIGTIMIWTSATVPSGWLRCDGSQVLITDFPELYATIGYAFGGSGNAFNLPDLVTRFPVGANTTASNIGTTESPSLSKQDRVIKHTHTGAPHTHTFSHTHGVPAHYHTNETSGSGATGPLYIDSSGSHTTRLDHSHTGTTPNQSSTGTQDNITWSTTTGRGEHTHTGSITDWSGSLDHQHRSWAVNSCGNTTNLDQWLTDYCVDSVEHNHAISANGYNDTNSTNPHNHDRDSSGAGDRQVATGVDSSGTVQLTRYTQNRNIDHRHDISKFYTDGAYTYINHAGNFGYHADGHRSKIDLNHRHLFSVSTTSSGHDHSGGLSMIYKNEDAHPTGSSLASDLRGVHTHSASSIKGRIGNTTGVSGNTAFVTTTPTLSSGSEPNTSSANFSGNTGDGVSPHQVVNFIIKVTNPQVT